MPRMHFEYLGITPERNAEIEKTFHKLMKASMKKEGELNSGAVLKAVAESNDFDKVEAAYAAFVFGEAVGEHSNPLNEILARVAAFEETHGRGGGGCCPHAT